MKRVGVLCLAAFCLPVGAQVADPIGPLPVRLFPNLTEYLQLTGEQSIGFFRVYSDWNQYLMEKRVRVGQIKRELNDLAKQDVLDPMAYGNRDVEMESICREAKDRQSQYREKARALLTPVQNQKLQMLEQAFQLAPMIQEAQEANLMGRDVKVVSRVPTLPGGPATYGILPGYLDLLPGCRPPLIEGIIVGRPFPMPVGQ